MLLSNLTLLAYCVLLGQSCESSKNSATATTAGQGIGQAASAAAAAAAAGNADDDAPINNNHSQPPPPPPVAVISRSFSFMAVRQDLV